MQLLLQTNMFQNQALYSSLFQPIALILLMLPLVVVVVFIVIRFVFIILERQQFFFHAKKIYIGTLKYIRRDQEFGKVNEHLLIARTLFYEFLLKEKKVSSELLRVLKEQSDEHDTSLGHSFEFLEKSRL